MWFWRLQVLHPEFLELDLERGEHIRRSIHQPVYLLFRHDDLWPAFKIQDRERLTLSIVLQYMTSATIPIEQQLNTNR